MDFVRAACSADAGFAVERPGLVHYVLTSENTQDNSEPVRSNLALLALLAFAPSSSRRPGASACGNGGYDTASRSHHADDHVSFAGTMTTVVYGAIHQRDGGPHRPSAPQTTGACGTSRPPTHRPVHRQQRIGRRTIRAEDRQGVLQRLGVVDAARRHAGHRAQVKRTTPSQAAVEASRGPKGDQISLISRHSHALARLWIDSLTRIVLRRETYHGDGTIATKTEFDTIRFVKDLPDDLFKMTVPAGMTLTPGADYGTSTSAMDSLTSGLSFKPVNPRELPDGFTFEKGSSTITAACRPSNSSIRTDCAASRCSKIRRVAIRRFDDPTPKSMTVGKPDGKYTSIVGPDAAELECGRLEHHHGRRPAGQRAREHRRGAVDHRSQLRTSWIIAAAKLVSCGMRPSGTCTQVGVGAERTRQGAAAGVQVRNE